MAITPSLSLSVARTCKFGAAVLNALFEAKAARPNFGRETRAQQMRAGHRLHPYGLPDAGGAGVEAAVILETLRLFAARFGRFVVVARAQANLDFLAGFGQFVKRAGKGRETAAMPPDFGAVDPHGRVVIYRAEMKQNLFALPVGGHGDALFIPHGGHEINVAQTRQTRFRAKRHGDLVGQFVADLVEIARQAGVAAIDFKLPGAVEVKPLLAHKLGARIFGAGSVVGHEKTAPKQIGRGNSARNWNGVLGYQRAASWQEKSLEVTD